MIIPSPDRRRAIAAAAQRPDDGDVVARLGTGRRLVALVSAGLLADSRSPAEHKLRETVARRGQKYYIIPQSEE
jgi:hypothetical protein